MHAFWLLLTYDLLEDRRIDDLIIKTFLILYYIKQIDSKLLHICSVINHRGCQNVVRTSVTHLAAPHVPLFGSYHIWTSSVIYYRTVTLGCTSCPTFLFLTHFDIICDLLLNRHTATWNLFVKLIPLEQIYVS